MPPERFEDNLVPRPASDIWSLGATLFELITGKAPFGEDGGSAQLSGSGLPQIDVPISKELKQIIYSCLDAKITERPTASILADAVVEQKPKNRTKTPILAVITLIIAIIGTFIWWNLKTDSGHNNKDYMKVFAGTWVYDNPEIQTSEKIEYDTSGIFHAVYYQGITDILIHETGVAQL